MATMTAEGVSEKCIPILKRNDTIDHNAIRVCSLEAYGDKLAHAIGQVFGMNDIREAK
ncbi:MAG: hypothetical protein MJZ84_02980 [Paludibacteraceae bacterium]|nr:hypothetical protein [Paludibacteraceae bacterium]